MRVKFTAGDVPVRRYRHEGTERLVVGASPDPQAGDPHLVTALAVGGLEATPRNLSLLRATLDALRNQYREHRKRPGVRQPARETEFYLGLATLYRALAVLARSAAETADRSIGSAGPAPTSKVSRSPSRRRSGRLFRAEKVRKR
jgi:hypothetical protein